MVVSEKKTLHILTSNYLFTYLCYTEKKITFGTSTGPNTLCPIYLLQVNNELNFFSVIASLKPEWRIKR